MGKLVNVLIGKLSLFCSYLSLMWYIVIIAVLISCKIPSIEITWPFDSDARLVFRSAHFATYCVILSVNFKPLYIGPIMSALAEKGDRKREIEQSPKKKKIKDSTISREDLDDAIANSIKLALKEQQSTLNSVVNSAVRDAMDSVLIPALRELREDIQATNKSVKELREEFEAIATAVKQTHDRVDSIQAAAREDRRTVMDLRNQLERLTEMTDMEDGSRKNNVRLVGLPEGAEGPDAAGFLRVNLSKWIPSLRGLWGTKQHHCTEDSTSSRRPGDDAVLGQREEIPQQDQCTQSSGFWQHSWACTERLCSGTHWCLHRHLQHLSKSGCCPHMLQSYHHHSSPEEVISILLQWLPSSSTHSYSHELLWTASHATHQVCPPPIPGPLPVCI